MKARNTRAKNVKGNILSLTIGCLIGFVIALPIKAPISCQRTKVERCQIGQTYDYDIQQMVYPESNVDHGSTMEEVISQIRDAEFESIAVFYGQRKLFERTDYSDHVIYVYDWPSYLSPKMTLLHNHSTLDRSFSYADLDSLFRYQSYGTAIVVTSEVKYTLTAPEGWPSTDDLVAFFDDRFGVRFDKEEADITRLVAMRDNGYVFLTFYDDYSVDIGFSSKLIAELANFFGLTYVEELN